MLPKRRAVDRGSCRGEFILSQESLTYQVLQLQSLLVFNGTLIITWQSHDTLITTHMYAKCTIRSRVDNEKFHNHSQEAHIFWNLQRMWGTSRCYIDCCHHACSIPRPTRARITACRRVRHGFESCMYSTWWNPRISSRILESHEESQNL